MVRNTKGEQRTFKPQAHLVRNLDPKCIRVVHMERFSTMYSMPNSRYCFDCDARPLRCVLVQLSFVPTPHGINEAYPC